MVDVGVELARPRQPKAAESRQSAALRAAGSSKLDPYPDRPRALPRRAAHGICFATIGA
jgi:hypothetical protein